MKQMQTEKPKLEDIACKYCRNVDFKRATEHLGYFLGMYDDIDSSNPENVDASKSRLEKLTLPERVLIYTQLIQKSSSMFNFALSRKPKQYYYNAARYFFENFIVTKGGGKYWLRDREEIPFDRNSAIIHIVKKVA